MTSKIALRKHRQVSDQSNQIKVELPLRKNIMNAEKNQFEET